MYYYAVIVENDTRYGCVLDEHPLEWLLKKQNCFVQFFTEISAEVYSKYQNIDTDTTSDITYRRVYDTILNMIELMKKHPFYTLMTYPPNGCTHKISREQLFVMIDLRASVTNEKFCLSFDCSYETKSAPYKSFGFKIFVDNFDDLQSEGIFKNVQTLEQIIVDFFTD